MASLVNQPFSMCALMQVGEGERLGTNAYIPWTAARILAVSLIIFFTWFSRACDILNVHVLAIIICFMDKEWKLKM